MGQIEYNIIERGFNERSTLTYNLSVLLRADKLSYLIADVESRILLLRSYTLSEEQDYISAIKSIFLEDSYLKKTYKEIKIGIGSAFSTFFPSKLYTEETKGYLIDFLARESKHPMHSYTDDVYMLEMKHIYTLPNAIKLVLEQFQPKAKLFHSSTALLTRYSRQTTKHKKIHVCIYASELLITVFNGEQFLFHNSFTYSSSQDCLYYILLAYQQFGLNPDKHILHLGGNILKDSAIYLLLYKYIREIHFLNSTSPYIVGEQLKEEHCAHFFLDLYSLRLCE